MPTDDSGSTTCHSAYAMRVIRPKEMSWDVTYGETMYGVPTGRELDDFPTLCVQLQ